MTSAWQDLIGNVAVVILTISLWTHAQQWLERQAKKVRQVVFSVWMGLGCISSMLLAVQLEPGVFFDLRTTIVVVSGLIGGPWSALITGTIAGAYRLSVGGAGAMPGVLGLLFSVGAGGVGYWCLKRLSSRLLALFIGGSAAGLASTAGIVFLPETLRTVVLTTFALPLFCLNGAATVLVTMSIAHATKLRNERHILRRALTEAPDFLYVKDTQSKFIAVNRGVARHHGFEEPRAMVGLTDYDLEPADRARNFFMAEQAVMREGSVAVETEETVADSTGTARYFVTSKLPIKDSEGDVVGLVGVTRDVTRYRMLEHDLRASRNLLAQALAEMSDGVAMFDAQGKIVFCNQRYSECFPLTSAYRKPGASLQFILSKVAETGEQLGAPQQDAQSWIEAVFASLKTGGEEQVQLFDGTWLHVRTRPGSDGSALVVVSDATVMKSAEAALQGLNEQLQTLATTDELTGLNNRRVFDGALSREAARAHRSGQSLSLLMIDVDHFKSFNDLYGHLAGDDCLRRMGKCLKRVVRRPGDLALRYGGEEFALILPDTDEDGAYFIAEALRNTLKGQAIKHAGSSKGIVTASVGIAVMQGERLTPSELIARADKALYNAKAAGRDRVMGWKHPSKNNSAA